MLKCKYSLACFVIHKTIFNENIMNAKLVDSDKTNKMPVHGWLLASYRM
jgi:hypothetical protein